MNHSVHFASSLTHVKCNVKKTRNKKTEMLRRNSPVIKTAESVPKPEENPWWDEELLVKIRWRATYKSKRAFLHSARWFTGGTFPVRKTTDRDGQCSGHSITIPSECCGYQPPSARDAGQRWARTRTIIVIIDGLAHGPSPLLVRLSV